MIISYMYLTNEKNVGGGGGGEGLVRKLEISLILCTVHLKLEPWWWQSDKSA